MVNNNNIQPVADESQIVLYQPDESISLQVKIDGAFKTVWLSIDQMAELFGRDRSVIGKHVRTIFKEGELQKDSVWAKFAYTASDGKYDKFIVTELCALYIFILGFYFNNIDNDIIYETQIRRISREFDDYRNRYGEDVDTDDETASSAETDYVDENGIYNEKFRRRLIDKLNSNGIKYCEYETNEEIGCKIAELLDNDDSVVAKYNGMYRIIFVDKKQSECDSILVESYKKIKAEEVK